MLQIGQQLFSLTQRDLQTLRLDPYFRTFTMPALGPGDASTSGTWDIPKDRALYLDTWGFEWQCGAASQLSIAEFRMLLHDNPTIFSVINRFTLGLTALAGDNRPLGGGVNDTVTINRSPKIVLPPGADPQIALTRSGTVNASNVPTFWLAGWLIPLGNMGRMF